MMRTGGKAAIAGAGLLMALALPVSAAEVSRSMDIPAAADVVWRYIGDFCGIAQWHPVIAKCEQSQEGGATLRKLTTRDGGILLERLLSFDGGKRNYSYSILESPLPVEGYSSTIKVESLGNNSKVTWSSVFTPKGVSEAEAKVVIDGIYKAGLEKLHDKSEQDD